MQERLLEDVRIYGPGKHHPISEYTSSQSTPKTSKEQQHNLE